MNPDTDAWHGANTPYAGAGEAVARARPHPARLTVGVVGAGRVGSALGAALAR
ncbi:MAG: hypothetical protein ACRDNF_06910, partial [Streptosporangiaceae bacterium]